MDICSSLLFVYLLFKFDLSDAIQCYSCKATGINELDANIKCLENAYLENCEEFYHYYNNIEGQTLPGDEYYYNNYDAPAQGQGQGQARGQPRGQGQVRGQAAVGGQGGRGKISEGETEVVSRAGGLRPRNRRALRSKAGRSEEKASGEDKREKSDKKSEDVEYEYEYEYYEEDDGLDFNANKSGFLKPKGTAEEDKDDHYCYNTASKSGWESYTVEKGCKRIAYCKSSLVNKPEWGNPWNFCCGKSRCNVKLVKDKPQRVFGMGCRRTDDCIQGHTSRPICPAFFKTCPRLSNSLVKMECRSQARTMASVKKGANYRNIFKEKKCYCSKGYYPKGPICTSGSGGSGLSINNWTFLIGLTSQLILLICLS